jgi:hypothetical protein
MNNSFIAKEPSEDDTEEFHDIVDMSNPGKETVFSTPNPSIAILNF